MIDTVIWILFASLLIGSLALGIFLLATPSDGLAVKYQNYMLRKTALPLKDEHFTTMPQVIAGIRVLGLGMVAFAVLMAGWVGYLLLSRS